RTALAATGIVRKRSGPGAPNAGIESFSPAMARVNTTARPYRTGHGQSGRSRRRERDREAGPASTPRPRRLPRDAFRHLTRPGEPEVSRRRGRGLAESPAAEESDDCPHHDRLKDLIARVDGVQAPGPAREQRLREE